LIVPPASYGKNALPQVEEDGSPGQGDVHRTDPCDHLPDQPGEAKGIDKKCPPLGSSGGVARGDFNGDGFGDLAIGIPFEDITTFFINPLTGRTTTTTHDNAGAVIVIYGSANGLTATGTAGIPTSQFWSQNSPGVEESAEAGDNFGWSLAAGDFDHDGHSDLAIGVPGEVIPPPPGDIIGSSGTGIVQVLYGTPNGLTADDDQLLGNRFTSATAVGRRFGDSLVWADFNGDTFGDLAVEVQPDNGDGAVIVFSGFDGGIGIRTVQQFVFPNTGLFTEVGPLVNLSLAAGKFNNDSFADLVVGAPFADVGTVQEAGRVHVLSGSASGLSQTGAQFFHQNTTGIPDIAEANDQFGAAVAAGDFNNDGRSDLAVGVPNESVGTTSAAGAVNVIYGSDSGLLPVGQAFPLVPSSQLWTQGNSAIPSEGGAEANDHFGAALASGDFNGDGPADLAIGVPDEDIGTVSNAGAVNVLYGTGTGLLTSSTPGPQIWHQNISGIEGTTGAGDRFGTTLTAWNFGKFSKTDLAIGVPGEDISGITDAGAVNVVYGLFLTQDVQLNPFVGLDATGDQLWHQDAPGVPDVAEQGDQFGRSLY